ncbi:MAG: DUF438 domain-containing protein [candidate division Zixibacteria bacterium CG_4_9_14_3_um_filter_46_8]|nr:MAG: DUF438 domain-containing protein [candidate division Zixibacteria bacterium CG_4_9_14_3_um_filter_46_8]
MSELINNASKRKELLKHMILQLHEGSAPEAVRNQLLRLMGEVPYDQVVQVEQELIAEGLPQEEILKLCDVHTAALKGIISHQKAQSAPAGHPVHTFKQENRALGFEIDSLSKLFAMIAELNESDNATELWHQIRIHFNALMDVEKHYLRKENLLFPYMEKHGITGPPKVMWGKHDETRELMKAAIEAVSQSESISAGEAKAVIDLVLKPASNSIEEMIFKEEEILFPMCLDTLTDSEWYEVHQQSIEIGFCLFDPVDEWKPEGIVSQEDLTSEEYRIQLPTGSLTIPELNALLNTIPFDLTFVDQDDTVRYFTRGRERIFARSRAILGRKVQFCHPPASVHIVEKIISDFKSGKEDRCAFWINMGGRFIHIEYYALRGKGGEYLGTLEVSQDLTGKRKLEGEQRLLSYSQTD